MSHHALVGSVQAPEVLLAAGCMWEETFGSALECWGKELDASGEQLTRLTWAGAGSGRWGRCGRRWRWKSATSGDPCRLRLRSWRWWADHPLSPKVWRRSIAEESLHLSEMIVALDITSVTLVMIDWCQIHMCDVNIVVSVQTH